MVFRDREHAGLLLAERLRQRSWVNPLVLGIPRGGVAIGAVLAPELGAELDVVLARKLPAPNQPELAIGAVSEQGVVFLHRHVQSKKDELRPYLAREVKKQRAEIARSSKRFRAVRSPASFEDRSIIITDDGIATGSTMIAALHVVSQGRLRASRGERKSNGRVENRAVEPEPVQEVGLAQPGPHKKPREIIVAFPVSSPERLK